MRLWCSSRLNAADWGPLGKHPDLDAIVGHQRLHLPLPGRLTEAEETRAWKSAAAEHHPDRGGAHHTTMQAVNGARHLVLGRGPYVNVFLVFNSLNRLSAISDSDRMKVAVPWVGFRLFPGWRSPLYWQKGNGMMNLPIEMGWSVPARPGACYF